MAGVRRLAALGCAFLAGMAIGFAATGKEHSKSAQPSGPAAAGLTSEVARELSLAPGGKVQRKNYIDDFIFGKMEADGVPHASLTTDTEFHRRIYLDLWGRLPDAAEVRQFAADQTADKRDQLIDRLLGLDYPHKPGYDDYKLGPWMVEEPFLMRWTYWFGDLFYNGPIQGVEARNVFRQYLYYNLKYNIAYDHMVREMLTATAVTAQVDGPANFLTRSEVDGIRDTDVMHEDTCDEIAVNATKLFLGIDLECVSCHDGAGHLERINLWLSRRKRVEFWRQAAFFGNLRIFRPTQNNQEFAVLEGPPLRPEAHWRGGGNGYRMDAVSVLRLARDKNAKVYPEFLLTKEQPAPGTSLRAEFARMITSDLQFAKATVNLFWAHFMTVGIVDPPFGWDLDRQDPHNPPPTPWTVQPSHPELLEALARDFQEHNFDLRYLMQTIVRSSAYQLSSRFEGPWKPAWDRYYARKLVRRLSAEEVYDALCKATNVFSEIGVAGTDKKVQFLMETYGPVFDKVDPAVKRFLDSFGRGNRKTTPSEAMPSVVQASLLLNSELVKSKVLASTKESLVGTLLGRTPALSNQQLVEELFLATLSRFPTAEEMKKSTGFLERYRDKGAEDLQWTLLNKLEFVVNY